MNPLESIYFLRPETVIWRSIDMYNLRNITFESPSLEIGCGDGSFMFSLLGGTLDPKDDIFYLNPSEKYAKTDLYDQVKEHIPVIVSKPRTKIDVGLDLKSNLLDEAKKYDVYKKLVEYDLNNKLPFSDESFKTIFSNAFYWVENIEYCLLECHRILKNNGKIIIMVPDISFKKKMLGNNHSYWSQYLDRGMTNSIKHVHDLPSWIDMLRSADFTIESVKSFLTDDFIEYHNYGTRHYSVYMIALLNSISPEKRQEIKQRIMKDNHLFIQSFIDNEKDKGNNFHLFVLSK